MRKTILNKKNGFTLVEALLSTVILSMSILTLATFSNSAADLDRKFKTRSNLLQVRTQIVTALSNQENWSETVDKAGTAKNDASGQPTSVLLNPDLVCVREGTACTTGDHPLTLIRKDGTVMVDATDTTAGFTKEGVPCNTYGVGTGASNLCIFRYHVTWKPICPKTGACVRPQIVTQTQLTSTAALTDTVITALQTQMNMQMNMLIERPIALPPVARNQSTYTNSTFAYTMADAPVVISPLTAVTSKDKVELVSFPSHTTAMGGTVQFISATQLRYTPAAGYYGPDFFQYKVRNVVNQKSSRGTVTVKVMTPYTWTGLAGTADPNSSNPRNFCGKAINGACNGTTFPAGNVKILVFNSTCTNCNARLDSLSGSSAWTNTYDGYTYTFAANGLEASSSYNGTIRVANNASFGGMNGSWNKDVNLQIDGGTFDASSVSAVLVLASSRASNPPIQKDYAVTVHGQGKIIAPTNFYIEGATYLESPTTFANNMGTVHFRNVYDRNKVIWAPGVEFYNAKFGFPAWGGGLGMEVSSNLIVKNNLTVSPTGSSDDYLANGRNPATWARVVPAPTIRVEGNLVYGGTGGGSHCDTYSPTTECLSPVIELSSSNDQAIIGMASAPSPLMGANSNAVSSAPSIRINKTAGQLTMTGFVGVRGDFIVDSVAGYNFTGSSLVFNSANCNLSRLRTATVMDFDNIHEVTRTCPGQLDLGTGTYNVKGNFNHGSSGGTLLIGTSLNSATIRLEGDFLLDGSHDHDALTKAVRVEFVGGNTQHIRRQDPAGTGAGVAHWVVNKTAGTNLYLDGSIATMADLVVNSGTLVASPGSHLIIPNHGINGQRSTLKVAGTVFESLTFAHGVDLQTDVQTKNLTLGNDASASGLNSNGHIISVSQDLTMIRSNEGYSNKIVMTGGNNQNLSFPSSNSMGFTNFDVNVNKAGGNITVIGAAGAGRIRNLCMQTPLMNIGSGKSLQVTGYTHTTQTLPNQFVDTTSGGSFTSGSESTVAACL